MEETHEYVVDCAHVPYGEDMVMVLPISINGHVHEPVIRCKDCRSHEEGYCCLLCMHTPPDFFCKTGRPRDGDG